MNLNEFKCPSAECLSSKPIKNWAELVKHIQLKHSSYINQNTNQDLSENELEKLIIYNCPIFNCKKPQFKGRTNIKRHFENNHSFDSVLLFLFQEQNQPLSHQNQQNQSLNHQNQQNQPPIHQHYQPLNLESDFEFDNISNGSSEFGDNNSIPILANTHTMSPSTFADKLCELIVGHKISHQLKEKSALEISSDYMNLFIDYLKEGKNKFFTIFDNS
jgi:hypothetical protein